MDRALKNVTVKCPNGPLSMITYFYKVHFYCRIGISSDFCCENQTYFSCSQRFYYLLIAFFGMHVCHQNAFLYITFVDNSVKSCQFQSHLFHVSRPILCHLQGHLVHPYVHLSCCQAFRCTISHLCFTPFHHCISAFVLSAIFVSHISPCL